MIRSQNMSCRTHYGAIGVKEDASQEEIRKTYRSAILALHPDKLLDSSEQSNPLRSEFLEVQRAWKVLGDPGSRALYDCDLRTLRQEAVAAEDVNVGDMMVVEEEEDGGGFDMSYQCRCGDFFCISSCELDEMGYQFSRKRGEVSLHSSLSLQASIVLPCGSCSLKLRLVID
ncbi:DPH4 homolog [Salvia splendens]|uniref:DPH4 homolog n=1 Tax=Salvia splendens TaxID=180675 RepID=UPI001C26C330|nr:DPH4 homolog [Salvia splendens]